MDDHDAAKNTAGAEQPRQADVLVQEKPRRQRDVHKAQPDEDRVGVADVMAPEDVNPEGHGANAKHRAHPDPGRQEDGENIADRVAGAIGAELEQQVRQIGEDGDNDDYQDH